MAKAHLQDIIEFANDAAENIKGQLEKAYGELLSDGSDNKIYEAIRDAAMELNGLADFKYDV